MKVIGFVMFFLWVICITYSQETKKINAVRALEAPRIDADLSDACWDVTSIANNFIQFDPYNGKAPSQPTEVKVVYNNRSVYFAAILKDSAPDSILTELCKRDQENGNTDFFCVDISPFNDGINAYSFKVTAAGVQIDFKHSNNEPDYNWNAVWKSSVRITDNGWIVEIEIPYSAIRFPNIEVQEWGINFWRQIRRKRERSTWNYIDIKESGEITQAGLLTGISNVKSPLRLSVTPYLSGYFMKDDNDIGYSFNGGLDLKYGLNESFTLDMTLIPDFGQVQSDDQVLNLSPFETFYGEQRPFFTEGTELFGKADIFYSRRIGGTPKKYDDANNSISDESQILFNPDETSLINATKLSGRTQKGLGIGIFNAMTSKTRTDYLDTTGQYNSVSTQPFTNYNMVVIDQSLKNNSHISLINTNVSMEGYIANVSGTDFKLLNKKKKYAISGIGVLSQIYEDSTTLGYSYEAKIAKISGNFLFSLVRKVKSDKYDPNDMGYLEKNNNIENEAKVEYNFYDPFWKLLSMRNSFTFSHYSQFEPRVYSALNFKLSSVGTFKNYLSVWFTAMGSPTVKNDYYETRTNDHRYLSLAPYYNLSLGLSPDYRKRFVVDCNVSYTQVFDYGQNTFSYSLSPRFRVNDKILIVYKFSNDVNKNNQGYISVSPATDTVFFGNRDVTTIVNTFDGTYIFNNKSSLSLRVRHYWSRVLYDDFFSLNDNGSLKQSDYFFYNDSYINKSDYSEQMDINYNAFTIDMVYIWNFAPGSELSFVWKNAILTPDSEYHNITNNFFQNLQSTFSFPQSNSLSLKIIYYLDYQYLKRRQAE